MSRTKVVSATEANRQFSSLLRDVAAGQDVMILSRGTPVATMTPVRGARMVRDAARTSLLKRLRGQKPSGKRDWTRDELYDRPGSGQ